MENIFEHQVCLHELDISYNRLKRLQRHTFNGMQSLKVLKLQGNPLQNLDNFVFLVIPSLLKMHAGHPGICCYLNTHDICSIDISVRSCEKSVLTIHMKVILYFCSSLILILNFLSFRHHRKMAKEGKLPSRTIAILAVLDLIMFGYLLLIILRDWMEIYEYSLIYDQKVNLLLCHCMADVGLFSYLGSTSVMFVIFIERYMAIVSPFKTRQSWEKCRILIILLLSVCVVIVLTTVLTIYSINPSCVFMIKSEHWTVAKIISYCIFVSYTCALVIAIWCLSGLTVYKMSVIGKEFNSNRSYLTKAYMFRLTVINLAICCGGILVIVVSIVDFLLSDISNYTVTWISIATLPLSSLLNPLLLSFSVKNIQGYYRTECLRLFNKVPLR